MLKLGDSLGRYTLLRRLAGGGMGEVFLATSAGGVGLGPLFAVKVLRPHFARDKGFVQMLIDEARISMFLSHRNIVSVLDFGEDRGRHYLAMEYVHGVTLESLYGRLRERKRVPEPSIGLYIGTELCRGLRYAHACTNHSGEPLNIVHRDVTPGNVLLSLQGEVKLTDFGIARAKGRAQETEAGVVKGKFGYLAPEMVRYEAIDHRADLFSLGVLLYLLFTGDHPVANASVMESIFRYEEKQIPPPSRRNAEVTPELDAIVMRALEPAPSDRWPSAQEFGAALSSIATAHSVWRRQFQTGAESVASLIRELMPEALRDPAVEVTHRFEALDEVAFADALTMALGIETGELATDPREPGLETSEIVTSSERMDASEFEEGPGFDEGSPSVESSKGDDPAEDATRIASSAKPDDPAEDATRIASSVKRDDPAEDATRIASSVQRDDPTEDATRINHPLHRTGAALDAPPVEARANGAPGDGLGRTTDVDRAALSDPEQAVPHLFVPTGASSSESSGGGRGERGKALDAVFNERTVFDPAFRPAPSAATGGSLAAVFPTDGLRKSPGPAAVGIVERMGPGERAASVASGADARVEGLDVTAPSGVDRAPHLFPQSAVAGDHARTGAKELQRESRREAREADVARFVASSREGTNVPISSPQGGVVVSSSDPSPPDLPALALSHGPPSVSADGAEHGPSGSTSGLLMASHVHVASNLSMSPDPISDQVTVGPTPPEAIAPTLSASPRDASDPRPEPAVASAPHGAARVSVSLPAAVFGGRGGLTAWSEAATQSRAVQVTLGVIVLLLGLSAAAVTYPRISRPRLDLSTFPPGARVTVDGRELPDRTPLSLQVRPGANHILTFDLEGHIREVREITGAERGETYPIIVELQRYVPEVRIAPVAAKVFVNNAEVGSGRHVRLPNLELSQPVNLRVEAEGYEPHVGRFERASKVPPAISVELRRR